MRNKFLSFISPAAIVSAAIFFAYSLVQLVGYAISTGAIPPTLSGSLGEIITFLSLNFKTIFFILLAVLLITSSMIYIGFILLARKTLSKKLKIASYIMLIASILVLLLNISAYSLPSAYSAIGISVNNAEIIFGIINIIFGSVLIAWKNKNLLVSRSLGILYVLEGIILLSILFMPVKISDFTIAIRILEAFLFSKTAQSL